jgi:hypothetical protein
MDTTCASVGRHPESTKDWSESPGAMRCARQKNRSPSVSSSKLSQYAGMAGWFSALSVMASRSNSSSAFQLFMFRKLSTFSAMSSPSSVVALYVVPKLPRSESLPDDVRTDSFVCHRLVDGEDAVVAPDLVPGRAMPRRAGDAGPIAAPSSPNERRHEVRRRPSRGRHDGCRVARCGFCFFDVNSEGPVFHTSGRHAVRPARGARRGGARRAPQVPAQAQTRARADTPFPGNPPGPDEPRGGRLPSPDVGPDDDDE